MIYKLLSCSPLALLLAAAPLLAQEASDSGSSSGSGASYGYNAASEAADSTVTTVETTTLGAPEESEATSFFFPGGYGYLPESISPGLDDYARPPIDFSLTIQQGYNDNIYSSSGDSDRAPKKGSATTQASAGINLLLKTPRAFFSLGGDAGALYYWDKEDKQVSPIGSLSSAFAYSLTPRLNLTARVNAGYYTQPNLTLPNAPTGFNSGDYFNLGSLFDVNYRWTPVFSTSTTFGVNTQVFQESYAEDSNYLESYVGQSFRYLFAPRFTGVAEVRFSDIGYHRSDRDSQTESVLAGFDWMMSSRLTSTFRGGVSFRQFELDGIDDAASPYVETGVGYRYGRGSMLQWTTRFGFEEPRDIYQKNQTFRTGLVVSQVLTPRINASLGVNYAYEKDEDTRLDHDYVQQLITGSARVEYIATRWLTVFGNYRHSENVSDFEGADYGRNEVTLGATLHF